MTESLRFRMFPRKQLDIRWADLAHAALYCAFPRSIRSREAELEGMFASPSPVLSAFTVRTGFDLCLGALGLPAGSGILMRSEERRVGEGGRSWGVPDHLKKKK